MGKTSSNYPYANGSVSVNGQEKASSYKSGNNIYSNYNMSTAEKGIYDYAQNSFLQNLPYLNVFSDDTQNDMRGQLNAYTQNGLDKLDGMYKPMLSNLKTDIASRFGNFDNSIFMDKLGSIEDKRADSMSSLVQDIMAKQSSLVNDELSRRYNYMNFLYDIQNQTNSNVLNYLGRAANNSSNGTTYNSRNNSSNSINNYANMASDMFGNIDIGQIASIIASIAL